MTSRIPVYQMSFGQNQKGEEGLLFPSELDSDTPSVLYTLPIVHPFDNFFEFIYDMDDLKVYFPFYLNNEYMELEAKISFPEFAFAVPGTDYKIVFEIDDSNLPSWPFSLKRSIRQRKLKYVGNKDGIFPRNSGFISILPVDIFEMDNLYMEHKGIFVGLTPTNGAGESDESNS